MPAGQAGASCVCVCVCFSVVGYFLVWRYRFLNPRLLSMAFRRLFLVSLYYKHEHKSLHLSVDKCSEGELQRPRGQTFIVSTDVSQLPF